MRIPDSTVSRTWHSIKNDLRHADELAQNENGQYATSAVATMDPIKVAPNQLLFGKKGIKGWAGGIPTDSQDTLLFAEMTGVRPMIGKVSPSQRPPKDIRA